MDPQDIILDHYHHPRHEGHLSAPTYQSEGKNLSCGDEIAMDIVLKDDIIESIAWTGTGCAISQASASLLSEHIAGKEKQRALSMTRDDMLALLGIKLSPARIKCGLLALEVLHRSLRNNRGE